MKNNLKKQILFVLAIVMLLGTFMPTQTVLAEALECVETKITEFTITTTTGNIPSGGYQIDNQYVLHMDWDASYYQNNLKAGDYFNITLPQAFRFLTNPAACNFDVLAPDNAVVATAVVTPNTDNGGGGNIKVTFTDYVENKYNVKGSVQLSATFNTTVISTPGNYTVTVVVGSYPVTIPITVINSTPPTDEVLQKWASPNLTSEGHVHWTVRINYKKANLTNVVIEDELTSTNGDLTGIAYVQGSFVLEEKIWDPSSPQHGEVLSSTNISEQVELSENNTKFRYVMGNIDGKQYLLRYKTTYKSGLELKNNVKLTSGEESQEKTYTFSDGTSGGQGQGDLISKIKIVKVDAEDHQIKLPGAEFLVTKVADGSTFTLTTDANGEVVSGKLIPGEYKIKETKAPVGYVLKNQEYTVTVSSDGVCIKEIENEPVRIDIQVDKMWLGGGQDEDPITAVLKANGTEVDRHELSVDNEWKYTFRGLRKYDKTTGEEIVYTVEEEKVPLGYNVSYPDLSATGDADKYLTIMNTKKKVEVKVTKAWVDNNDQDGKRPDSVTIKLFADGAEVSGKTLTLNEANNWTGTFTDLDEYLKNGKIEYTVKEEPVGNGYISVITGSAEEGYTVTNTREPEKTVVEGSKIWNDKDNQDGKRPAEITINLLKNGTKIETKTVKEEDDWSWKFENLDKYENGNEITYSISEEQVEGYSAEIIGYDVKNSYTPGKTSIQVTKVWRGTPLERVTIHLLADGKEVAKQDLHKGNAWQHTFTDLEKYLNGKEINYSITEDPCPSYITEIVGTAQKGFVVTNSELTVPPTPPRHDPPARIELPKPKHTVKERTEASAMLPRTGEKADRFVYGLGLVLLALCSILLRKKLR